MYCPHCGADNESKPSYCRQCGQSLVSVRLAVDKRVDEVTAKFTQAEDTLAGGLLTFLIFFVVGLINLLISGTFLFTAIIVLGFIICLPIVLVGLRRIDRLRLLLAREEPASGLLNDLDQPVPQLREAPITSQLDLGSEAPDSVTEHTTIKLKVPASK